jgi:hypothetical protein
MVNDPLLSLTKTDIGAMTSAFPAAYGEQQAILPVSLPHTMCLIAMSG